MPIDALNVLCAQLTHDLFAIAKFLFKAAPFFDAEYLTNGSRYGHSCYKIHYTTIQYNTH